MSICRQMMTKVMPHAAIKTGTASQSIDSGCAGWKARRLQRENQEDGEERKEDGPLSKITFHSSTICRRASPRFAWVSFGAPFPLVDVR